MRASSDSFAEFNTLVASDPDLTRIVMKGLEEPIADWDALDWSRFDMFARSEANRWYDVYQQWKSGFYPDEEAEWLIDLMPGFLRYPAWRIWWEHETKPPSRTYGREFVEYINSREPPPIGMRAFDEVRRAMGARGEHDGAKAHP